jgi:hypothetical protein
MKLLVGQIAKHVVCTCVLVSLWHSSCYSAVVAAGVTERLVGEELGAIAGETGARLSTAAETALADSIAKEVGTFTPEAFERLSPAAKEAFQAEIKTALKTEIGALKAGLTPEAAAELAPKIAGEVKQGFAEALAKPEVSISAIDKANIASDIKFDTPQLEKVNAIKTQLSDLTKVPESVKVAKISETIEATPEGKALQADDRLRRSNSF